MPIRELNMLNRAAFRGPLPQHSQMYPARCVEYIDKDADRMRVVIGSSPPMNFVLDAEYADEDCPNGRRVLWIHDLAVYHGLMQLATMFDVATDIEEREDARRLLEGARKHPKLAYEVFGPALEALVDQRVMAVCGELLGEGKVKAILDRLNEEKVEREAKVEAERLAALEAKEKIEESNRQALEAAAVQAKKEMDERKGAVLANREAEAKEKAAQIAEAAKKREEARGKMQALPLPPRPDGTRPPAPEPQETAKSQTKTEPLPLPTTGNQAQTEETQPVSMPGYVSEALGKGPLSKSSFRDVCKGGGLSKSAANALLEDLEKRGEVVVDTSGSSHSISLAGPANE